LAVVMKTTNIRSDKKKNLGNSLIPDKTVGKLAWNSAETTVVRIFINISQHDSQNLNDGHPYIRLLQSNS